MIPGYFVLAQLASGGPEVLLLPRHGRAAQEYPYMPMT